MASARPPLQAKYELLLENDSSTFILERRLLSAVIVFFVLIVTVITVSLSWMMIQPDLNADLYHSSEKKGKLALVVAMSHRLQEYERAMEILNTTVSSIATSGMPVPNTITSAREFKSSKLVCYYAFPESSDLVPEDIDPTLCTHINIASMAVDNASLSTITPAVSKVIRGVVALKIQNPNLKVLVCIGGYSKPGGFNDMVSTHESRKKFINEVVQVLENFSLDGVDLDWEFPAWRSGFDNRERVHFTQLLEEFRQVWDKHHKGWLLSVAVASPKPIIDLAYDVTEMSRFVDYINLMAYDYHFYLPYYPVSGANAPLFHRPDEKDYFATLNTNWSSWYWVEKGMPKHKIVVGVPTYGHSFKLMNADNHGWEAPCSGNGNLGTGGFVTYPEVCWFLDEERAASVFDQSSKVPYAYLGQDWVSFDNGPSVAYKTGFVINNGFAGVMVFSLNQDDYKGVCTGTSFVLTQQVKNVLFDDQL